MRSAAIGGTTWRVWLADTRAVPGACAGRCLLFDTGDRVRRVWGVPDDWAQMPPATLLALADATPCLPAERQESALDRRPERDAPDPR